MLLLLLEQMVVNAMQGMHCYVVVVGFQSLKNNKSPFLCFSQWHVFNDCMIVN